jgi:serine/threonine protein kinase
VLLSLRQDAWQIADFGLTHEGASGIAIVTGLSRGSEGYRGPEMIKIPHVVAQQTDIFALGCTLGEVITGKQLFSCDYNIFEYMYSAILPKIPSFEVDERSNVYASEIMKAMLGLNWRKRPTANDILKEIGDPEVNWQLSLARRAKEMGYPEEDSPAWQKMHWRPYWY